MAKNNKGNYYKYKTKKWFQDKGYKTEYLERYQRIKNGIMIKQDLFSCDGMSMNGEHIVFWNSILGKKNVSAHVKRLFNEPFPKSREVAVWVILWEKGVGEPDIIEVPIGNFELEGELTNG